MGDICVAILILKMEENKQHFWHIMLYYFKKGKTTTDTHKKGAVIDQMCQKWFAKFLGTVDVFAK